MKHLKKLGLLVLAVTALTALAGAGSASATPKFTASSAGPKLNETTLQQYVFTVTESEIKCTNFTISAVTEGTECTSQSGTVSISGCSAFGLPATVITKTARGFCTPM